MMQLTEEQRKALIAEVHYNLEHCFCSEKTTQLMKIALASLTADPVATASRSSLNDLRTGERKCSRIWGVDAEWGESREVEKLYTTPPAPALRLPDMQQIYSLYCTPTTGSMNALAHIERELLRLNATAPQPDSSMNLGSFDPRPDFTPSCRIKTCHNNDGNQVED